MHILFGAHTNDQMDDLLLDEVPCHFSFWQFFCLFFVVESDEDAQEATVGETEQEDGQVQAEQTDLHFSSFHSRTGEFLGQFGGVRCDLVEDEAHK